MRFMLNINIIRKLYKRVCIRSGLIYHRILFIHPFDSYGIVLRRPNRYTKSIKSDLVLKNISKFIENSQKPENLKKKYLFYAKEKNYLIDQSL